MKLYILVRPVLLEKRKQAFKIRPVNLKSKSTRTLLETIPASVEYSSCPKPQHLFLCLQNISTKIAIFIATKHKSKADSYLNLFSFFFIVDV